MRLVAIPNEPEAENGQEDKEQVTNLVALVPWADLAGVRLITEIVNSAVEPVTIAIHMELLEVSKLVERVMLQIVHDDLVLLARLRLVLKSILGDQTWRLKRNEFAWVHRRMHFFAVALLVGRHAGTVLLQKHALHAAPHEASCQHFVFSFNYYLIFII